MVLVIHLTNLANTLHRRLVTQVTTNGITGIGGIHHYTTVMDDLHRLMNQPYLWIFRMYFEVLTHKGRYSGLITEQEQNIHTNLR